MVSETVMYIGIITIGVVTFGFFSFTFANYSDQATDLTASSNISGILADISAEISELLGKGRSLRGANNIESYISISMILSIPETFSAKQYSISLNETENGVELFSQFLGENLVLSSVNLGIDNSTVVFSGNLESGNQFNSRVTYLWSSASDKEQIILANMI